MADLTSHDPVDTPLSSVTDGLAASGADGQFRSVEGGRIECLTCHRSFDAADLSADRVTRLEGASDPDDTLIVIPLSCPHCGTSGTLIANYGPSASSEDADVLLAVDRSPREGDRSADATPGIAHDEVQIRHTGKVRPGSR